MAPVYTGSLSSPQIAEFKGASGGSLVLNTPNLMVDELRFASGAGSYTLTGTGSLSGLVVGIDNQATAAQSIGVALSFGTTMPTITNAGTLTISGNITNGSGTFGLSVTNNGKLTLSGAFNNANANGASFGGSGTEGLVSGVISGAGAVRVSGTGLWTFSGANTYTGNTTVSGGTLAISADNNLGATPSTATAGAVVLNGGTLEAKSTLSLATNRGVRLDASGGTVQTDSGVTLSYGGIIAGAGNFTKTGSGTFSLTGANTYTGATVLKAGTLALSGTGALPSGANVSLTPAAGASTTLDLGSTSQTIGTLYIAGGSGSTSTITLTNGAGTLTLGAGNVVYDGSSGPNGAWISGGTVMLSGNTTFNVSKSATTGVGGTDLGVASNLATSGNAVTNLIKTGDGLLQLQGNLTYSGATIVNHGRLRVSGSLPSNSAVVIDETATAGTAYLDFAGSTTAVVNSLTFKGAADSYNFVDLGPGGVLTLGGNVTVDSTNNPGYAEIYGGTALNLGSATRTFTIGHSTSGNASVDLYVGTSITGTVGLIKEGLGSLVLLGNNTYTGDTTVNAGTLQIGGGSYDGILASNIVDHATVIFGGYSNRYSGVISGNGTVKLADGDTLFLAGNNTYTGGTTIGNWATLKVGTDVVGGGTTGAIVSGNITNNGSLVFLRSDSITYGGIAGNGSVEQAGSGTLTLAGTNTYQGGTYITGGTVTGALPTGGDVHMNGGNLIVGSSLTIGGLSDTYSTQSAPGNVSIATGTTLTLTNGGTFSGTLTGAGALVLTGNSYEVLHGNATHTGGTTIGSGTTLIVGDGATSGSLSGSIVDNGQLQIERSDAVTYGGITGTGSVAQNGTGTLTLSGTNTYSGTTYVYAGNVTDAAAGSFSPNSSLFLSSAGGNVTVAHDETVAGVGGGAIGGNSSITLNSAMLTIKTPYYIDYSGTIGGTGSVTITGSGMQVLSGANTYSGNTSVTSGSLIVANPTGSATGTGTIKIGTGGGLQFGNYGTGGMVSGNIVNDGYLLFARTDTAANYGGVISGSGSLQVNPGTSSGGTLTLSGANTYTGSTRVLSGTLRVGADNALPSASRVEVQSGGTLTLAGNQTLLYIQSGNTSTVSIDTAKTLTIAPTTGSYGGTLAGTVTGAGSLTFAGASGTGAMLTSTNTYSGGTTISSGTLYVGADGALGSGLVTVAANAGLVVGKSSPGDVTLTNNVTLASGATLAGASNDQILMLGGTVTAGNGSTVHVGDIVLFGGTLRSSSAGSQLTFDSTTGNYGRVVFTGTIDSSITSLTTNSAGLIFGSSTAVPTGLTIKGTNGYVGVAALSGTAPTANSVLGLLDSAFTGVLGFDSNKTGIGVFSDAVNLSAFGSRVTLGSSTAGILTGTITPSSSGYLFGNGGGVLVVGSNLTGSNNVTVDSVSGIEGNGLLTILRGANDFTGTVAVTNSALVLDSASALPAGRTVTLGANGYLGYTEAFTGATSLANLISTRLVAGGYTGTSIIGFDSHDYITNQLTSGTATGERVVTDTIDLRTLGPISLGTTTRATLSGTIYAPTQNGANQNLSLVAANDGRLTVTSNLTSTQVNSVTIGATGGKAGGTVVMAGSNSYTGGTTLLSGNLVIGDGSYGYSGYLGSLGSGTLSVPTNANKPALLGNINGGWLSNAIALGSNLRVGLSSSATSDSLPAGLGSAWLDLSGVISGVGGLDVYGHGVSLMGSNTFSGGVVLNEGSLFFDNDNALGSGTLTLRPGRTSSSSYVSLSTYGNRTIANNLVFDGAPGGTVNLWSGSSLVFNGSLTLNNDAKFYTDYAVYFNGPVTGTGRFTNNSWDGRVVLSGTNTYTGGTESQYGSIVFANAGAIPAAPIANAFSTSSGGYIGIGFVPTSGTLQATFIDRFNPNATYGTIGFDSGASVNSFSDSINLSGFYSSPRLGSSSRAVLTGTITPTSGGYRFGNGGGWLEVTSALTNASDGSVRSLNVSSWAAPLTLHLTGANTFSGGVQVDHSALVFASGALPATGSLYVGYNGYIGTEDSSFAANPTSFIDRFSASSNHGIVGFDGMTVSGNISLARFTGTTPAMYLGTSSTATITGGIVLPTTQTAYQFAGYKGGQLTVQTVLTDAATGARSVVIGDTNGLGTFASSSNADATISGVTLSGANTYSGGTTLNAGRLYVASDTALGTGTLTVANNWGYSSGHIGLYAAGGSRSLSNNIALGNAGLAIGGSLNLTLSGQISGSGSLYKMDSGALTLSGANSFSSSINIYGGSITFASATANGTGVLGFSDNGGASVTFLENSTVNGLFGSTGDTVNLTAGKTLTINSPYDSGFGGTFAGSTGGLIVAGGHSLELYGASTFAGPLTVQGNSTLLVGDSSALGATANAVTLNSGKLATLGGVTVQNPITITRGVLGGSGTFKATTAAAAFTFGTNAVLSPGLHGPGQLSFDGSLLTTSVLVLAGGGTYRWQIMDATSSGGWDTVAVNGTVNITANATAPFNFSINSVLADGSSGLAVNFDRTLPYSWTVLTATSITGLSNSSQLLVDSSGFLNPNSGYFTLGTNTGNTALVLTFNPVPEPSTYVLLAAGLGALAYVARRRRR